MFGTSEMLKMNVCGKQQLTNYTVFCDDKKYNFFKKI